MSGFSAAVNVAVTSLAADLEAGQVSPAPEQAPLQPVKEEPVAAFWVSTIVVSEGSEAIAEEQVLPQLMPFGLDLTAPLPTLFRVSVFLGKAVNSASTVL